MQPINSGGPSRRDLMPSRNLTTRPSEVPRQPSKQSIGQQLVASRSSRVEMEQESEGGQLAAMQSPDIDSKVRMEVNLGIQQIRTIEQLLRTAPQGLLGRPDVSEAQALRMALLTASAIVMGSFSKIMGWLSAYPPNPNCFRNDNFSAPDRIVRADSPPLSTSHTYDSDPHNSPRYRSTQQVINPNSPVISPCHTPLSGSGMSDDSANPASPLLLSDADGDVVAAAAAKTTVAAGAEGARRPTNEAITIADPEAPKQKSLSVKRKFMPKFNCQQRASDPAHDGPPDDGHTWRKYGQKDILGSRNARSYYRCTHKIESGCPAIKYVQRSDEEPALFDVTYRGNHTCQSIHHQQHSAWHFPSFPEQMAIAMNRVHQFPPSDLTSSRATVNYSSLGGTHMNSSATQSQVTSSSDEIVLGVDRHDFSQLAAGLPMVGSVPSTVGILDISRFSSNPASSMDLGMHHQDFHVKPDDNNPSQPQVFDVSRLARDTVFSPDLFTMLLANSRPGQNDIPFTIGEEDLQSETKRVRVQHHPMEPARSTSDNRGQMDKSAESQYEAKWGVELDADFQVEIEGQISRRYYSNSSIISDSSQSRPALPNNQTTSAGRKRIASPMKESDNSVETLVSSLPMPGFSMDEMDYESFPGGQSFYC